MYQISVSDPKPHDAELLARSINGSLRNAAESLENTDDIKTSPVQLLTVTDYTPATNPSSPNRNMNMALGTIIGLLSGLGISVLRQQRREENLTVSVANDGGAGGEAKPPVVVGSRKANRTGGKS